MTEDNRIPNFWWCPTHHLYRGGDKRPCADAVRLVPAPPTPTAATWSCARCGSDRWVGWRAGPEHEGWPRKAQCVPCGHVQALPATTTGVDRAEITEAEASEARDG